MKKNKKGFTLIEIIVVIVILAVLLAVAVPSVLNYLDEADNAKLLANARAVMNSAQAEVIKEAVTSDGITSAELTALPAKIVTASGVDCTVNALYTGEGTISNEGKNNITTSATPMTANTDSDTAKRELSAVKMTINGVPIIAVINDKIYLGAASN